ncbi:MAG: glycosyltransferase [Acidimicrobiales bacterium]
MLTFLLQLRDSIENHRIYLFTFFTLLTWTVWLWKLLLSNRYRPFTGEHETTTSVVIPVVDEPEELFRDVLRRITEQRPTEIHVVINGPRNEPLERICDEFEGVHWQWTTTAGKRNAVKLGVEASSSDVVVLVDSDTIWMPGCLTELVKPFADAKVGGVTTHQRILHPERHVLTRWADWMESVRNEYSMPAMSVLGTVGCLPGRTIAFRRTVLEDAMDNFMNAKFLGVFLEVSDDRTLTNETLKQGYRTVYQSTSMVYTDAPTNWKKMAKQQFRWARGSQYNTLRMLPWMVRRTKPLAFFYLTDIALPFLLLGAFTGWVSRSLRNTEVDLYSGIVADHGVLKGSLMASLITLTMTFGSSALRQSRHLRKHPGDLLRIPTFLMINTLMLMPVRLLGFVRMAHNAGWGTRAGGFSGERNRNWLATIPYMLAITMIVGGLVVQQ